MAHSSWGSGWPYCQSGKIKKDFAVSTVQGTVTFPGGVRYEIVELVMRLVQETARRGYKFGISGNPSYGCWGFNCRPVAGTSKPSNHSWGLAVDINAPRNPMSYPLKTDMPSWMPALWKDYGFRWGGTYTTTPDSMHYEFLGSIDQAKTMTQKARTNHLGEARTTTPLPPTPEPPLDEGDDFMLITLVNSTSAMFLSSGKLVRISTQGDKNGLQTGGAPVWANVTKTQWDRLVKAYGPVVG